MVDKKKIKLETEETIEKPTQEKPSLEKPALENSVSEKPAQPKPGAVTKERLPKRKRKGNGRKKMTTPNSKKTLHPKRLTLLQKVFKKYYITFLK